MTRPPEVLSTATGGQNAPASWCAVLTSFNRRNSTLECLVLLESAAARAGIVLRAVLVDDGSSDGTADEVARQFTWATVLRGDGSLYWSRGMNLAMQHAIDEGGVDALLWLNDDTHLRRDALKQLLDAAQALQQRAGRPGIVVGATADAEGRLTYSGCVSASRWRTLSLRKVFSHDTLTPCDTMNGNVVLLPMAVVRSVGNIDPAFEHAMGDLDYGFRARQAGVPIAVAPGYVGTCSHNPAAGSFQDVSLPLRQRWALFVHRKVLPPRSWLHLTRRHGGWLWPLHFAWPYASFFARASWSALRKTV